MARGVHEMARGVHEMARAFYEMARGLCLITGAFGLVGGGGLGLITRRRGAGVPGAGKSGGISLEAWGRCRMQRRVLIAEAPQCFGRGGISSAAASEARNYRRMNI
jgi:hypothetical protein